MKLTIQDPPRAFLTGALGDLELRDCGTIELDPCEQLTFNAGGATHDVVRTSWGFYATGSLNDRLPRSGLRPVLTRNDSGKFYLLLVVDGCDDDFREYADREGLRVVSWLDDEAALARIVEETT